MAELAYATDLKSVGFNSHEGSSPSARTKFLKGDIVEEKKEVFRVVAPYKRKYKRIGRNDKCFCGSGRKYKHCCLPAAYASLRQKKKEDKPDTDVAERETRQT